jgi:chromosome segregation ATPase
MSSSTLSSIDLKDLSSRVEHCVQQVGNDGSTSARFCSELKGLLADTECRAASTQAIQLEMANLQNQIAGKKRDIKLSSLELQKSSEKVEILRKKTHENEFEVQEVLTENQETKFEIKAMMEDNEQFQAMIDKGADWTQDQKDARDEIVKMTEKERLTLDAKKNELLSTRQQINRVESNNTNIERKREGIAMDLRAVQDKIDASNDVKLAKQAEIYQIEKEMGELTLQLQETRDQVTYHDQGILQTQAETKKVEQEMNDIQAETDKGSRALKLSGKQVIKLSTELEKQHLKNIEMDNENANRMKDIQQKKIEAKALTDETVKIEKKKQILSTKLAEVEKERMQHEGRRDELKLKLSNTGSVELKMMGKELESQKCQIEGLGREMQMLERRRGLKDKNSILTNDIMASNETTLLNLQNEVGGLYGITKECKNKIEDLHTALEKERIETQSATMKRDKAIGKLREQKEMVESLQKELDISELQWKHKQDLCDSAKTECNLEAKSLAENHEEMEIARRELSVIVKQNNSLRLSISHTENNTIAEHYNHYHIDEEKNCLQSNLEDLKREIGNVETKMERNQNELSNLEQRIDDQRKEYDACKNEYSTLTGNRDLLGSLLVQKNSNLDKIQITIKNQRALLHQSELQYSALISSVTGQLKKLKEVLSIKQHISGLEKIKNELEMETRSLEHRVHKEKIKTTALREELGRPMNVHRWRALEHTDPQKYERIMRIQRLQKQIITSTEQISEKDMTIREQERHYLQAKRIADHQPQLREVQEQLELYRSSLSEKTDQMGELELEIIMQKKRVMRLHDEIDGVDLKKVRLEEEWVQQKQEGCDKLKGGDTS